MEDSGVVRWLWRRNRWAAEVHLRRQHTILVVRWSLPVDIPVMSRVRSLRLHASCQSSASTRIFQRDPQHGRPGTAESGMRHVLAEKTEARSGVSIMEGPRWYIIFQCWVVYRNAVRAEQPAPPSSNIQRKTCKLNRPSCTKHYSRWMDWGFWKKTPLLQVQFSSMKPRKCS